VCDIHVHVSRILLGILDMYVYTYIATCISLKPCPNG